MSSRWGFRSLVVALPVFLVAPAASDVSVSALDPQHRELADLTGAWSVKQSFWSAVDAPAKIDKGTAEFVMVLNQHHLRQTLHIADGTNFEGLGYIGYDNASGRFFSTWMDVNFPGVLIAHGGFDSSTKSYVFRGSMSAAGSKDGDVPVREVMTIFDHDHFKYEYYETHRGKEALTVRLEYTRSGSLTG
jgi:hypothetical protein